MQKVLRSINLSLLLASLLSGCSSTQDSSSTQPGLTDAGDAGDAEDATDAASTDGNTSQDAKEDAPQDTAQDTAGDVEPDSSSPIIHPSVDGIFDEWTDEDLLAVDPVGDATSVFDLGKVWATSRGTALYLRAQIAPEPRNMQSGWPGELPLGIRITLPDGQALSLDLRAHTAIAGSQSLRWSEIGFQLAPTTAATEVEMKIELSVLGVVQGDTIHIDFFGSDSLDAPVAFVFEQEARTLEQRDPTRAAGTTFRIASLNVEWDGLTAPGRAEAIGRLLGGVAADIYCLQEVWNTGAMEIAQRLAQIDPHGDGASWNVHRTGDTAIATRGPLTPLSHGVWTQPPYTGAGVELGNGSRLMVFTPRPTCCGFIGNPADQQRIAEFQHLANSIKKLRNNELGASFEPFKDAPVIVFGDWNLVGSTTPLDLMTDPSGPALERWLLRHLVGDGAIYTWRNDVLGTFAPGALDLLAHGSVDPLQTLTPLAGFIVDSEQLDSGMLELLGIFSEDSTASDHFLLVADFGI